jgi:hypothetical protein
MSFLDIATSLKTNSLTLLVGTGFSMYLTDNNAPSWTGLLADCAKNINDNAQTFNELFTTNSQTGQISCNVELTMCAQMLELEYKKNGKDVRVEIAELIKSRVNRDSINDERLKFVRDFFSAYPFLNVVTTNYDTLFNDYILPENNRIFVDGVPVGKDNCGLNIYHIHGSVINPESIVLTMDDYFRFQHKENYFSRKLYTLLQETTVVVLGYSLGDFNLNRILNEAKNTKQNIRKTNDIYYVTRSEINHTFQRYYLNTYGIEVIEKTDIGQFFNRLGNQVEKAETVVQSQRNLKISIINDVVVDEEIKSKQALDNIFNCLTNMGMRLDSARAQLYLERVFSNKWVLARQDGAWEQYTHFANWLIELASIIPLRGTHLEGNFLDNVCNSFRLMSKVYYTGYSWQSFVIWESRWTDMLPDNRELTYERLETEHFSVINNVGAIKDKHLATRGQ